MIFHNSKTNNCPEFLTKRGAYLFVDQRTLGAALDSPVKQVPESAEVEMDIMCSSDGLTPVSIFKGGELICGIL